VRYKRERGLLDQDPGTQNFGSAIVGLPSHPRIELPLFSEGDSRSIFGHLSANLQVEVDPQLIRDAPFRTPITLFQLPPWTKSPVKGNFFDVPNTSTNSFHSYETTPFNSIPTGSPASNRSDFSLLTGPRALPGFLGAGLQLLRHQVPTSTADRGRQGRLLRSPVPPGTSHRGPPAAHLPRCLRQGELLGDLLSVQQLALSSFSLTQLPFSALAQEMMATFAWLLFHELLTEMSFWATSFLRMSPILWRCSETPETSLRLSWTLSDMLQPDCHFLPS
jgi:hypothetical protein